MRIEDVELRFVERCVPAPEFGDGVGKTIRVLQWRKLQRVEDMMSGNYTEWTDWQDVPLVLEP